MWMLIVDSGAGVGGVIAVVEVIALSSFVSLQSSSFVLIVIEKINKK